MHQTDAQWRRDARRAYLRGYIDARRGELAWCGRARLAAWYLRGASDFNMGRECRPDKVAA